MAIKDIFLPLVGEPDAAAIAAIDKCVAVAGDLGAQGSGRTGWWTNPRTGRRCSPRARSSKTAARRCPMRSPCSTTASAAFSRRVGSPKIRSRSRN